MKEREKKNPTRLQDRYAADQDVDMLSGKEQLYVRNGYSHQF
jgi:hypothetical protein